LDRSRVHLPRSRNDGIGHQRPRFTPGRGWRIFFGIIRIIAGIVVLAYPFDSIVTLALVAGIWLIVLGVFEIISAFGIRKAGKTVKEAVANVGR